MLFHMILDLTSVTGVDLNVAHLIPQTSIFMEERNKHLWANCFVGFFVLFLNWVAIGRYPEV